MCFFNFYGGAGMAAKESVDTDYIDTEMGDARLALTTSATPATLTILPLYERPFFPAQAFPVLMDEEPWLESVKQIGETEHHIAGLVMVRDDAKIADLQ